MKLLLIEDDPLQAEWVTSAFKRDFKHIEVWNIHTERGFLTQIDQIETWMPDLIILDVMIRWTDPAVEMSDVPEDIISEGFLNAGFRCMERISRSETLYAVPIIMYSVLATADIKSQLNKLSPHVFVVHKDNSPDELMRFARSAVRQLSPTDLRMNTRASRILQSFELKPGWFGLRVDLKSLFGRRHKS